MCSCPGFSQDENKTIFLKIVIVHWAQHATIRKANWGSLFRICFYRIKAKMFPWQLANRMVTQMEFRYLLFFECSAVNTCITVQKLSTWMQRTGSQNKSSRFTLLHFLMAFNGLSFFGHSFLFSLLLYLLCMIIRIASKIIIVYWTKVEANNATTGGN